MQPEALFGEPLLCLRGKENSISGAQDPVLKRYPVEPLLDVLQRKCVLEVGVQHAVGEHDIRRIPGKGSPGGKSAVLPQAIHHDAIKAVTVISKPGKQFGVESIGRIGRPKSVDWKLKVIQVWRCRIIQRHDLAGVADRAIAQQHPDGLCRAAGRRVQGSNDVKNAHQFSTTIVKNSSPILLRSRQHRTDIIKR
jgi:hypothetical protein